MDVCIRALEMAETETRKQTLLKPMSGRSMAGSPPQSPRKGYKTPKKHIQLGTVDLREITKVRGFYCFLNYIIEMILMLLFR